MKLLLILSILFGTCYLSIWSQLCSAADQEPPQCFQITCGFRTPTLYPNNTACHTCTQNDIGSRFTECDDIGYKKLIYFWKPPATCLASRSFYRLPEPILNVPCDLECSPKEFLNTTTMTCQSCLPGSTSIQSRYIVESWKTLPQQMTTYCASEDGDNTACQAWRLKDDTIDSGSNWAFSNLNSTLTLSLEVTKQAAISFSYQFSSDYTGARFFFGANGQEIAALSPTNGDFTVFSIDLAPNFYDFYWQIRKGYEYSFQNIAILKNIHVYGLASGSTHCSPCPPGTFTNEKYQTCVPCPRNTYSNSSGSTECIPCPDYTISDSGSTSCSPNPRSICTGNDYYAYVSYCNAITLKQTVEYTWIEPRVCDPNNPNSIGLPNSTTQDCDVDKPCKWGQVNRQGNCVYCDKGYYATSEGCDSCKNGYGTHNVYYIDRFTNDTGSEFYGFCRGDCATRRGWRFAGDYADTGYSNGISTMAMITQIQAASTFLPTISVIYQLSCTQGNLIFTARGSVLQTIPCTGCDTSYYNATFDLNTWMTIGSTNNIATIAFSIVFQKLDSSNGECNIARVHNMTIQGSVMGGSATCQLCPPGTFANTVGNCDPCPSGTYTSTNGSANCTLCNANQFSLQGAVSCKDCGRGMQSVPGGNCTFLYGVCSLQQSVEQIYRSFTWQQTAQQLAVNGYSLPSHSYFYPPTISSLRKKQDTIPHMPTIPMPSLQPMPMPPMPIISRMYFNLEARNDHQPCGSSIVCSQSGYYSSYFGPVTSLGDGMDLVAIVTNTTIGVKITSISFTNNCYDEMGNNIPSRTVISILCDPMATTSISQQPIITQQDTQGCHYSVTVYSSEVCPICDENDWYMYRGDCIDGQRQVYYVKKLEPFHMCTNGVQYNPSSVVLQSCYSAVVNVEAPYWVIAIVVAIVGLIFLFGLSIFICCCVVCIKYRRLNHKYYKLLKDESVARSSVQSMAALNTLRIIPQDNQSVA